MAVSVHFVGVGEGRENEHMRNAYKICEQYKTKGISTEWISEEDCSKIYEVSKQDVFVLKEFAGPVFERFSKTSAIVVGPRCLSCCLTKGLEIPGPDPVYTIPMLKMTVSCTCVDYNVKKTLMQKIIWMGGKFENNFTAETTHLISAVVLSDKYIKATSLGIPIMKVEWIQAVWEQSLEKNISASDPQFNSYKLPIFYNLIMSSTGFNKAEKNKLSKLIESNGGTLLSKFDGEQVKILITEKNAIGSDKYKAALVCDVPCVSSDWVHKSIEIGYALDVKDYLIQSTKTSSPHRISQLPDMSLDLSVIPNMKSHDNMETFQTVNSDLTNLETPMQSNVKKNIRGRGKYQDPISKELAQLVDNIELKEVKKAGLFLDGCCVFTYGLTATRREKLQKVIARAGAVRYDQPAEPVTHAICGDPSSASLSTYQGVMPHAVHVTVRWLVDSLNAKMTLEETPYLVFNNERPSDIGKKPVSESPMSKRNMQLLRTPKKLPPVPRFNLDDDKDEDNLIQQYIQQKTVSPVNLTEKNDDVTLICKNLETGTSSVLSNDVKDTNKPENTVTSHDEDVEDDENTQFFVFEGLTFELQDLEEEYKNVSERIVGAGGNVVQQGGMYIVVPLNVDSIDVANEEVHIVTSLWLEDCIEKEQIVPIEYYHKPVKILSKPFVGLVFAISTYAGSEREFIIEVAGLLGGKVQPSLCRRETSTAQRSTHLICSEASGAKYNGAMLWGLPVITSKWLLDCIDANEYLPEESYLLNKTSETDKTETSNDDTNKAPILENLKNTTETNVQITNKTTSSVNSKENEVTVSEFSMEKENIADEKANKQYSTPPVKTKNDTPQRKSITKFAIDGNCEMSPASRYIAMARQGLLGFESQETPIQTSEESHQIPDHDETVSTPPDDALSTPVLELFSPSDRRRILAIKRGERPSNSPRTPKNPFDIDIETPDSSFGSALCPKGKKMTKSQRKRLMKFCDGLPNNTLKITRSQNETPVSELTRKYISKQLGINKDKPSTVRALDMTATGTPPAKLRRISTENEETAPAKQRKISREVSVDPDIAEKLNQLKSVLTGVENSTSTSVTPRSFRSKSSKSIYSPAQDTPFKNDVNTNEIAHIEPVDSQLNTVGWSDVSEMKIYKFMLSSNIANPEEIINIITRLGGTISTSNEYDASVTHLLCQQLTRSEKVLGCLSAGKWMLHPMYIMKSQEAGRFIDEELYEWGNPKSNYGISDNENENKFAAAAHRCRLNQTNLRPLPFSSHRVIVHIVEERKNNLINVIQAGGGQIVNIKPPFEGTVDATLCLVEQKRMGLSNCDLEHLAKLRIPVCPPVVINNILMNKNCPNLMELTFHEYKEFLKK